MRIRCPSCSATYDVPDTLLARPRTVRCAQCGVDWTATPIEDEAPPEAVAEPPTPIDEEPEPARIPIPVFVPAAPETVPVYRAGQGDPVPQDELGETPLSAIERLSAPMDLSAPIRRHDRYLTAAWAGSFAVLAALGVAGYTKRDALMREWPASKRVYSTLGLAPLDTKTTGQKPEGEQDAH